MLKFNFFIVGIISIKTRRSLHKVVQLLQLKIAIGIFLFRYSSFFLINYKLLRNLKENGSHLSYDEIAERKETVMEIDIELRWQTEARHKKTNSVRYFFSCLDLISIQLGTLFSKGRNPIIIYYFYKVVAKAHWERTQHSSSNKKQ